MRKYELVLIIKPAEEDAINALISKFETLITSQGGAIEKIDRWGKRRLAYEVKESMEGYYCLFYYSADPKIIAEIDRVAKITDGILKHMIVKEDE